MTKFPKLLMNQQAFVVSLDHPFNQRNDANRTNTISHYNITRADFNGVFYWRKNPIHCAGKDISACGFGLCKYDVANYRNTAAGHAKGTETFYFSDEGEKLADCPAVLAALLIFCPELKNFLLRFN